MNQQLTDQQSIRKEYIKAWSALEARATSPGDSPCLLDRLAALGILYVRPLNHPEDERNLFTSLCYGGPFNSTFFIEVTPEEQQLCLVLVSAEIKIKEQTVSRVMVPLDASDYRDLTSSNYMLLSLHVMIKQKTTKFSAFPYVRQEILETLSLPTDPLFWPRLQQSKALTTVPSFKQRFLMNRPCLNAGSVFGHPGDLYNEDDCHVWVNISCSVSARTNLDCRVLWGVVGEKRALDTHNIMAPTGILHVQDKHPDATWSIRSYLHRPHKDFKNLEIQMSPKNNYQPNTLAAIVVVNSNPSKDLCVTVDIGCANLTVGEGLSHKNFDLKIPPHTLQMAFTVEAVSEGNYRLRTKSGGPIPYF